MSIRLRLAHRMRKAIPGLQLLFRVIFSLLFIGAAVETMRLYLLLIGALMFVYGMLMYYLEAMLPLYIEALSQAQTSISEEENPIL